MVAGNCNAKLTGQHTHPYLGEWKWAASQEDVHRSITRSLYVNVVESRVAHAPKISLIRSLPVEVFGHNADSPPFVALAGIPKRAEYRNFDFNRFIYDDLATSCKNLVNFGPVTPISSLATYVRFTARPSFDVVFFLQFRQLLTDSIAHSAKRRLFNLLRGRFWGFSPCRGDTLHRWGEIWHGGGDPHRCNDNGIGPKTEIFTDIWPKCGI